MDTHINLSAFPCLKSKRILLLSASASAGHGRAAEALRAEAQAHFPGIIAKHIDVMTAVPRSFRALSAEYYIKLVDHHPSVWAYLYHATDKMPAMRCSPSFDGPSSDSTPANFGRR